MSEKKIEDYPKSEIIAAIYKKQQYDHSLIPALKGILALNREEKAHQEWEAAALESKETLNAYADYTKELLAKHGGSFKLRDLTKEDLDRYLELAEKSQAAEKEEAATYERYNELIRNMM